MAVVIRENVIIENASTALAQLLGRPCIKKPEWSKGDLGNLACGGGRLDDLGRFIRGSVFAHFVLQLWDAVATNKKRPMIWGCHGPSWLLRKCRRYGTFSGDIYGVRLDQRRYLNENATSRLRGSNNCLMTVGPALLARVLRERVGVFLLDTCQVGFAVMFIIGGISFFLLRNGKSPRPCEGLGFGWVQP